MRRRGGRDGFGLIAALSILAVTAILAAAAASAMKVLLRDSLFQERLLQAQLIAESGAEAALARLSRDGAWREGFRGEAFGGGYYDVALGSGACPTVTATGYSARLLPFGRARRTVRLTAEALPVPSLAYGVLSDETLSVSSYSITDGYDSGAEPQPERFDESGHVATNADLALHSFDVAILGNAVYRTGAPPPADVVSGAVTRARIAAVVPFEDGSAYASENDNETGVSPASAYDRARQSLTVSSWTAATIDSGVYYFRELRVEGSLATRPMNGPVVIFVDGPVTLTGAMKNASSIPADLILYGQARRASWALRNRAALHAVIAAPQADIRLGQELFGAVAGRAVSLELALVHFDRSLQRPARRAVMIRPKSWRVGARR